MKKLDRKVIDQTDAIERLFCKPLEEASVAHTQNPWIAAAMWQNFKNEPLGLHAQIIQQARLKMYGYAIDNEAAWFMGIIASSPGEAVMYSYDLMNKAKRVGVTQIKLIHIQLWYAEGFYDREALKTGWESQKLARSEDGAEGTDFRDNLLDYGVAGESLANNNDSE